MNRSSGSLAMVLVVSAIIGIVYENNGLEERVRAKIGVELEAERAMNRKIRAELETQMAVNDSLRMEAEALCAGVENKSLVQKHTKQYDLTSKSAIPPMEVSQTQESFIVLSFVLIMASIFKITIYDALTKQVAGGDY